PVEEDFGGAIHGNEELKSIAILANGQKATLAPGGSLSASSISMEQKIKMFHTSNPSVEVAESTMLISMTDGGMMDMTGKIDIHYAGTTGLFYPFMFPVMAYASLDRAYLIRSVECPGAGRADPADYYGPEN